MNRVLCLRPRWKSRPRDAVARAELARLAAECERFSPTVGFDSAADPDSLLLEVGGTARHFGGEAGLCGEVLRWMAQRDMTATIAVADTVSAAWALAHYALPQRSAKPSVEKVVIQPASLLALRELLAPLPPAALRIAPTILAWLRELGIRQIGQLEQLPRKALGTRFGSELLYRLDQALGRMPELIVPHHQPPLYEVRQAFEISLRNSEALHAAIEAGLEQLVAPMAQRQQGITRLRCQLREETGTSHEVTISLYRPTARAAYLAELIQLRIERLGRLRPIDCLHWVVTASDKLVGRQRKLFAELHRTPDPRHLTELTDRLASRLGEEAVLRPRLVADHQPELACRFDSLVRPAVRRSPIAARIQASQRPLQLARQPLRLDVISIVPDGPPLKFRYAGREHRIVRYWGPERIETGWWRGRSIRRDYYRVETTTGYRYWLFRHLRDQRWFLHGWFD